MESAEVAALQRLEDDGLLRREASCHRTTRRWQTAMARAAFRLLYAGSDESDLRLPVACALLEVYGELPDEELAAMVTVMTPIEADELDPRVHIARSVGAL